MLRQVLSKALLPNLERDLTKSVSHEVAKAHQMADCFLSSSQVYAFVPRVSSSSSASFAGATPKPQQRLPLVKVEFPAPTPGLFH
mmetsp:Transcript_30847/g.51251  ORF Transcript_30847/g.51251 Transcript_30847/m.51251 type:complete len:85 (+) Transcript_30847:214-468(+)